MRRSVSAGVIAAVVVVVVVVAAVAAYMYYTATSGGRVYVYLTDPGTHTPAPTASNSSPTAIYLTVTSIMLHSTSGSWVTVSNKTVTVELTSSLSFLASATIPPGNYTEVRLVVSAVTVSVNGVNVSATLPSGVLKIPIIKGGLDVKKGQTAYLVIYMGPHLTQTGTGQYILRPVLTAEAYYSPPSNTTTG